jgi:hypothetical protein
MSPRRRRVLLYDFAHDIQCHDADDEDDKSDDGNLITQVVAAIAAQPEPAADA